MPIESTYEILICSRLTAGKREKMEAVNLYFSFVEALKKWTIYGLFSGIGL